MNNPPLRILIVDDMQSVRHDLGILLELTGAVEIVGEAADGQQAMEAAERLRPDVVLMDLVMPGMNGYEATRRIKERGLARRIVVLTVHGDANSLQRARHEGADALIIKGAPLEALVTAILSDQDWSIT